MIVNTGGEIRGNTLRTLNNGSKTCKVLDREELNGWDVDWWQYVNDPESLQFEDRERYTPHSYQKTPSRRCWPDSRNGTAAS